MEVQKSGVNNVGTVNEFHTCMDVVPLIIHMFLQPQCLIDWCWLTDSHCHGNKRIQLDACDYVLSQVCESFLVIKHMVSYTAKLDITFWYVLFPFLSQQDDKANIIFDDLITSAIMWAQNYEVPTSFA